MKRRGGVRGRLERDSSALVPVVSMAVTGKISDTHNVVLQVLAHARKLDLNVNTCGLENILRTNTAQHEDVRAADGTSSQDDLLLY